MVEVPPASRGKRPGPAGFTLLEVVLAVAMGAMVLGGITVGYRYAKRQMIIANQRAEVNAFRTIIENVKTAKIAAGNTTYGPSLVNYTTGDYSVLCGVLDKIPSLKVNPYTGTPRKMWIGGASGSCVTALGTGSDSAIVPDHDGPSNQTFNNMGSAGVGLSGSSVYYLHCDAIRDSACATPNQIVITINLITGSTVTYYNYAIFASDSDGNIVAAAGGDKI